MDDVNSIEKLKNMEKDYLELQEELRRTRRKPVGLIAYIFLAAGVAFIGLSLVHDHTILAFIGTALSFWGALLLYIKPTKFIRKEILDASNIGSLINIQHFINRLEYDGTPLYISPGALTDRGKVILYYPKSDSEIPSDEILSDSNFCIQSPPAVKLIPTGHDLFLLFEKELKSHFSSATREYIINNLRKAIVDGLEIAEAFEIQYQETTVEAIIQNSIFNEVITLQQKMASNPVIVDPLTSSIACVLAASTRHPITIESIEIDNDNKTVKAIYEIKQQNHNIIPQI